MRRRRARRVRAALAKVVFSGYSGRVPPRSSPLALNGPLGSGARRRPWREGQLTGARRRPCLWGGASKTKRHKENIFTHQGRSRVSLETKLSTWTSVPTWRGEIHPIPRMTSRDLEAARVAYSNADGETDPKAIELSKRAHDAPRATEDHKCAAPGAPVRLIPR